MKKTFTVAVCLLMFAAAHAQISITRTDIGNINDKIYYASRDTFATSITVGDTGVAQTWDFTAILPLNYDSVLFVDPSTDPDAPAGANLMIVDDGEVVYYNINNDSMVRIQEDATTGLSGIARALVFPMIKGSNFEDTIVLSITGTPAELGIPLPGDSVRIDVKLKSNTIADASGLVKTPKAEYESLRIKTILYSDIKVSILALGVWAQALNLVDTAYTYQWMAKDLKYYVAQAETDKDGKLISIKWQVDSVPPVVGLKQLLHSSALKVYPNPAASLVNVSLTDGEYFIYNVYDMNGKLVKSGIAVNGEATINTTDLPNGLYHCHIETDHAHASKRFVVSH